jgi:hypothetical protein
MKRRDSETKQRDGKTKRSGELRQWDETTRREFFAAVESLKEVIRRSSSNFVFS